MKRIFSLVLCFVLVFCLLEVSAGADSQSLRFTYISSFSVRLSLSATSATVSGSIIPKTALPTDITVKLQEHQSNGSWSTIASWSNSDSSSGSEAGGSVSISANSTYRAYAIGHVYASDYSLLETASDYNY
ncbi:MAG: hypothetical protein K5663_10905 [Clostridiales bacterium]|nr:hypothetical protein [Clostridiales bacterium]